MSAWPGSRAPVGGGCGLEVGYRKVASSASGTIALMRFSWPRLPDQISGLAVSIQVPTASKNFISGAPRLETVKSATRWLRRQGLSQDEQM